MFDDNIKVAKGTVKAFKPAAKRVEITYDESQEMNITAEDIYDLLREREYAYRYETILLK